MAGRPTREEQPLLPLSSRWSQAPLNVAWQGNERKQVSVEMRGVQAGYKKKLFHSKDKQAL